MCISGCGQIYPVRHDAGFWKMREAWCPRNDDIREEKRRWVFFFFLQRDCQRPGGFMELNDDCQLNSEATKEGRVACESWAIILLL